ncbi:MAG: HigA family addiction module antidote protein [Tannerellaceae bacterium]|jgi:addiction module HigA family antidote|nr:HigA family addiction module antidote protein [Tannerellaceae bacterium]
MGNLGYGFCPTHPGEILKDEIEYRKLSQRKLAAQMGMSYSVLNEILNAHRPLTASTALMFEAALGVEADTLMRMQTKYTMQVARKDPKLLSKFDEIRKSSISNRKALDGCLAGDEFAKL